MRDRPRMVTLLDPAGQPVVGASMRYDDWWEPHLRTATFPMGGLHPDRVRRVIFKHEKRKLIGFLVARGDGDSPYTVHMQKWGAIRGRLIDDVSGKPLPELHLDPGKRYVEIESNPDATAGEAGGATTDTKGLFRVDELVPGQRYSAKLFRNLKPAGTAFENVIINPGETRNLGDIRIKLPATQPATVKSGT
jgi:hypothetical protein